MKKLGLVLGSGGARGWAHLGVLDALAEAGIKPAVVVGTSMGALVGAVYVSGHLDALRDLALRLDWKQALYYFLDMSFPRSGLIDGTKIARFVGQHVGSRKIEELPIPFAAVATDVESGREVVLRKGDVMEAVRASFSVPGIFTPVQKDGAVLVDGGLVNPVPVRVARELGAGIVVAVDVTGGPLSARPLRKPPGGARGRPEPAAAPAPGNRLLENITREMEKFDRSVLAPARKWFLRSDVPNVFDVLGNTLRIAEAQIADMQLRIQPPDVLIRPDVGDVMFMEFHRAREMIRAGHDAAREKLAAIAAL